jgi:hypothetical protein
MEEEGSKKTLLQCTSHDTWHKSIHCKLFIIINMWYHLTITLKNQEEWQSLYFYDKFVTANMITCGFSQLGKIMS